MMVTVRSKGGYTAAASQEPKTIDPELRLSAERRRTTYGDWPDRCVLPATWPDLAQQTAVIGRGRRESEIKEEERFGQHQYQTRKP